MQHIIRTATISDIPQIQIVRNSVTENYNRDFKKYNKIQQKGGQNSV
jgi:hypothetical protein